MKRHPAPVLLALAIVLATATGVALSASSSKSTGRIGPVNRIQPNGRKLNPVGKLTKLGNFPTNGRLTPDGRFLWTLSAGRGINDIRIVNVKTRKVIQTIRVPGNSGGLTMTADGKTAYVSGIADSPRADETTPDGTPGKSGAVTKALSVNKQTGQATLGQPIPVPAPQGTKPPQNFPPTNTGSLAWPRDVAVSKDGKTLLVALNLASAAAIVDVASKSVKYVTTGDYPYGAAITSDGKTGLVGSEVSGAVSVIDLASASQTALIQAGAPRSHPESIAIDPKQPRAYVPLANQDEVAVLNTKNNRVVQALSVEDGGRLGTSPTNATVSNDGCR